MTHPSVALRHSDFRYVWLAVVTITGTGASSDSSSAAVERYGTGTSTMLSIYQRYISPLKGGNICPMYPSCSQYAKCAFERSDPATAFMATCDRLVRCGRDVSSYPMIAVNEGVRRYDPPDSVNNAASPASSAAASVEQGGNHDSGCASFALALFAEKKYLPAELEFERIVHSSAGRPCRLLALQGLLDCAYRAGGLDVFMDTFYGVTDSLKGDTAAMGRCGILLAKRCFNAGDYNGALGALCHYAVSPATELRAERCFIAALCHLAQHRPERALACADSIPGASRLSPMTDSLRNGITDFYAHERSPALAGVLGGILPGAGYLYAGRPATASASLLINGLFFWTAFDFIKGRYYGAAATSIVLGSGFYFGNIRGSIIAVQQNTVNARKRKCAFLIDELHYTW
jgi:putative component of membrane protein insertase Oxa1/YidC/SpoIIIJ protein YidD/TM2 domain-containing membrane protein YozV